MNTTKTNTPYNLTRTNRKTLSLQIRQGELIVRSPLKLPIAEIEKFIESKQSWISKSMAQSKERVAVKEAFSLNYGDSIPFRGSRYPIVAKEGNRISFDSKCFYMPQGLNSKELQDACIQIYKHLAKGYIPARTTEIANTLGLYPASIKITSAKTRWGSCSNRATINFSWRLILVPDDLSDYVIVHELAHLKELNHSTRFWSIISDIMPDYIKRQERLKELQNQLLLENW